jgi:hypothetical protein
MIVELTYSCLRRIFRSQALLTVCVSELFWVSLVEFSGKLFVWVDLKR